MLTDLEENLNVLDPSFRIFSFYGGPVPIVKKIYCLTLEKKKQKPTVPPLSRTSFPQVLFLVCHG